MSTIKVNSIEPVTVGSEDYFLARAWVNFNGTGTIAIRADGNVSSLTDNNTGDYTVSFSNSLTNANYAAYVGSTTSNPYARLGGAGSFTTSSYRAITVNGGNTAMEDQPLICSSVSL